MKWIKTSERLPDKEDSYCVKYESKRGLVYNGIARFSKEKIYANTHWDGNNDKLTHWLDESLPDEKMDLIQDAMDAYYRKALDELGKKDLGDIERKNWEGIKKKCYDWFKKHPL